MRLGAFTVVDAYPELAGGDADRAARVVDLAVTAESAGLSSLWIAEHHFHPGGVCPSPPVLLAACGARTRTIRLGSLVCVLPFHRPVDVAEEYALVDRLLGGRLNLGVGSGYLPLELEGFGVAAEEKRERFETTLARVLDAFAGRPVRLGGASSPEVRLNVRPVQLPHPPLWVAVQRREALEQVARRGLSVALIPYATVDSLEELAARIQEYRGSVPAGTRTEVVAAVHVYAGDRPERARAAFRRYVESRLAHGSTFLAQKSRDRPPHASPEAIEASGLAIFGPAAAAAEGLAKFASAGVDELLGIFDFGGLAPEEVDRSVRAVAEAWGPERRSPSRLPAPGGNAL